MARTVGLVIPSDTQAAPITCPICGKEYKTEATLAKHMEKEHAENSQSKDD